MYSYNQSNEIAYLMKCISIFQLTISYAFAIRKCNKVENFSIINKITLGGKLVSHLATWHNSSSRYCTYSTRFSLHQSIAICFNASLLYSYHSLSIDKQNLFVRLIYSCFNNWPPTRIIFQKLMARESFNITLYWFLYSLDNKVYHSVSNTWIFIQLMM